MPGDSPTLDPDVLTVLAGAVAGGERGEILTEPIAKNWVAVATTAMRTWGP
jgi:hypothetical protein